ncbi:MAG: hypothetical protein WB755_29280, partial [Terriglobales bacterium]
VQSDHQVKYDGSKAFGNHLLRFGVGYNRIQGGGFAEFLGLAPAVGSPSTAIPFNIFPGGAANPLNYPVTNVTLGNGQGFSSEKASFGFPGGGLGPDNRFSWYVGDSWKVHPNFTLTVGLRYVRDTGRTDSDLGAIPALDQFNNQFYSGLGNPVNQPNQNFAPQLGFAWDPKNDGKTVLRGGIGLFYENSIWNNNLFDRPARLPQGLFLGSTPVCSNGAAQTLPFTSTVDPAAICGQAIGSVTSQILQLQQEYQAFTLAQGPANNGAYIGNALADGIDVTGTNLFAPQYVAPRSVQMNIGIQREIRRGIVFTADYLRNVSTHNLLSVDTNHIGDARFFNMPNAQAAVATTNVSFGCGDVDCAIAHGATITDYASNGLDSGYSVCGGFACSSLDQPGLPHARAAFPGINQNVGANQMLFPIGRSVYNGLQTSLRQDLHNPLPGIRYLNLQVSYAFSRYVSTARDNDFINFATDNANPTQFIGPNGLDRTHQLSFGGTMDLPAKFRLSLISHFDSPLPSNVTLPVSGLPGGLFQTDVTGDGTGDGTFGSNGGAGDLLPGTNIGGFGRSFGVNGLNQKITAFNNNMVGQPTPAGQVLISNGLFTLAELQALGGVMGGQSTGGTAPLPLAPAGAIGQAWLKTFDLSLSWAYKFRDRLELRPGVSIFNLFNFANFDGPAAPFSSILDGTPGSPNGTTNPQPNDLRLGLGSGVNALGSPRVVEFSLKLSF